MISWFHFNFIIDFSWLSFPYLSSTGEAQPILLPSLPTHRAQVLPTTHHTVDHLNTPWIHSPANLNPNQFSNQTPCGPWPPWMDEQMSTQSLRGNIECWKGLGVLFGILFLEFSKFQCFFSDITFSFFLRQPLLSYEYPLMSYFWGPLFVVYLFIFLYIFFKNFIL